MHLSRETVLSVSCAVLFALSSTACALDDDLPEEETEAEEADEAGEELSTELFFPGCEPYIDVGLTIRSGNWIKGSGSFNNGCGGLYSVTIRIERSHQGGSWQPVTAASRFPSPGQAYAFSPPDYLCTPGATWSFRTRVQGILTNGQSLPVKYSNTLTTNCS